MTQAVVYKDPSHARLEQLIARVLPNKIGRETPGPDVDQDVPMEDSAMYGIYL